MRHFLAHSISQFSDTQCSPFPSIASAALLGSLLVACMFPPATDTRGHKTFLTGRPMHSLIRAVVRSFRSTALRVLVCLVPRRPALLRWLQRLSIGILSSSGLRSAGIELSRVLCSLPATYLSACHSRVRLSRPYLGCHFPPTNRAFTIDKRFRHE